MKIVTLTKRAAGLLGLVVGAMMLVGCWACGLIWVSAFLLPEFLSSVAPAEAGSPTPAGKPSPITASP